jgi:hypothetical protein
VKEVEKSIQLKIGKLEFGKFTLIPDIVLVKLLKIERMATLKLMLKILHYSSRNFMGKYCIIHMKDFCNKNDIDFRNIYRDLICLENNGLIFIIKVEGLHYIFFPYLYGEFIDSFVRIVIRIYNPKLDMEFVSESLGNYMNKMKVNKRNE